LEAEQRGFFTAVPEYRVTFAWESLRESFGALDFESWRKEVALKTGKNGLIFSLNWTIPPKSATGLSAFKQVQQSKSRWSESLLQWEAVPENWPEFQDSLRKKLQEQYQSVTRRRVVEEATSQAVPECLANAMQPIPRLLAGDYARNLKDFERQQTRIGFAVLRGPESDLRRFLEFSAGLQASKLSLLNGDKPTRAALDALRSDLLVQLKSEIKNNFQLLSWSDSTLLWPALGAAFPAETAGLSQDQLGYALKAPLGSTLLPNTLEAGEIWMVTGERRGAVVKLPFSDPQVQAVLANRFKTQNYIRCAARWFGREIGKWVHLASGVTVSGSQWEKSLAEVLQ